MKPKITISFPVSIPRDVLKRTLEIAVSQSLRASKFFISHKDFGEIEVEFVAEPSAPFPATHSADCLVIRCTCGAAIANQCLDLIAMEVGTRDFSAGDDLVADIGLYSLERIALGCSIEEAFDIRIEDDDIDRWRTPIDVITFVSNRVLVPA